MGLEDINRLVQINQINWGNDTFPVISIVYSFYLYQPDPDLAGMKDYHGTKAQELLLKMACTEKKSEIKEP